MRSRSLARAERRAIVVFVSILAVPPTPTAGFAQDLRAQGADDLTAARVQYIASCARCHGVDGGGGEGPPLARAELPRAPDDETLIGIMENGIPGTGMPASWWLSSSELQQVARYVRSLASSGAETSEAPRGDPARGRVVYERAGCGACHLVRGSGTARGPDLTTVGARRGARYLREAIVDPAEALPRGLSAMSADFADYLLVRAVDADGDQVVGMRLNEDTYTIQLKDADGVIHSLYKPALRSLDRAFDRSLMPGYGGVLSDDELDDLVAYLATLTGRP